MVETSLVDAIAKQVASRVVCDIEFEGKVILTWPMQSVPVCGDRIVTPHHGVVWVRGREWREAGLVMLLCERWGD